MPKFWIRGTDTYFAATGATLTVPTGGSDSAPNTIKAPASPEWLLIDAYGASPELQNGETFAAFSGAIYQVSQPRWVFRVRTHRYGFDADWSAYLALVQALAKPYVYFAMHTYDVDIHPANTCIPVVAAVTVEHNYDGGYKRLEIEFKKRDITGALDA